MFIKYLALFCLIGTLSACSYWPHPSTGGYAQHYIFKPNCFRCSGPLSPCQINTARLAHNKHELCLIRSSRLVLCHPARYEKLRLLGQQIAQEIASQLYVSAHQDLNLFECNLKRLKQLYTPRGCKRITYDDDWESLKLRIS